MKKLDLIIRPHKLEDVKEALASIGVQGMTISEVKGFGRQRGHTELYRGTEYAIAFLPKIRVEVLIPDHLLDQAVEAAIKAAWTGKIGDGKLWVTPVLEVIRIRTGEVGEAAL